MGRRGPAKVPVDLRILNGETRPSQIGARPVRPRTSTAPLAPADMEAAAKVVWRRVMREQAPGIITSIDRDGLRVYCEAVARYEAASRLLATSQPLVRGQGNLLVRNPMHLVVRDNADLIKTWARELGLSPAARAGLQSPEKSNRDDPVGDWEASGS